MAIGILQADGLCAYREDPPPLNWISDQITLIGHILVSLLPAVPITIAVVSLAYPLALLGGLIIAGMRRSKQKYLNLPAQWYADTLRGVPLLVQIFFIYFGLGNVLHLDRFVAGVLAIALCYAAYLSEIFRAAITAIPKGQHEAALSVGMTRWQLYRHVVLPQAFRIALPPMANEFTACLKDTSLVSIIGLRELTRATREYYSTYFVDFQTWLVAGLIYLILNAIATRSAGWVERKLSVPGLGGD